MPKIIKILGKSALCFVGLAAAGWATDKLCNILMSIHGQIFYTLLFVTILGYILWFLLAAAYAYTLFLIFRNEKCRFLIIALNGAAVFLLLYVLMYMIIYPHYYMYFNGDILYISVKISRIAGPVTLAMALMFRSLSSGRALCEVNKIKNKAITVIVILIKSVLCFIALAAFSYGYDLLRIYAMRYSIYAELFGIDIFWPLMAVAYAYALYRLLKKYAHRQLIIIINAAFLLVVWGLVLIPGIIPEAFVFYRWPISMVCGNTALLTIALIFIFKSVEKRGVIENSYCKDCPY